MENLNPVQQQAVEFSGAHLLIVAGPGTGKTHTLTHRIGHLLQNLEPDQKILAITFTKKAAKEMQERLSKLLPEHANQVEVGTFHQCCLNVLRQFEDKADVPKNFQVASTEDLLELVHKLWPDLDTRERKDFLENYSRWKSQLTSELHEDFCKFSSEIKGRGWLDFDDLIRETVLLLTNHSDCASALHNIYRYICVDEYQDINALQQELLKLLVQDNVHITAIGDPNQAIYGFRGSDVKFFHAFTEDFVPSDITYLTDNYRSSGNLLEASSQVIVPGGKDPSLTAQMHKEGRLTIYAAPTEKAEAEYVVHQIEMLLGGTSMFSHDSSRVSTLADEAFSFGDIAILYRLNAQRHALEQALLRSSIPFGFAGEERPEEDPFAIKAEQVSLLTLHASKGLEFPVVFVVGCEEELLPLNLSFRSSPMEEERRLFYVGMTRAKQFLYLTRSEKRIIFGERLSGRPSPFLSDIEEELKAYDEKRAPKKRKDIENQMELF